MFTGIIRTRGTVTRATREDDSMELSIAAPLAAELTEGDSVAVNGACLTVLDHTDTDFLVRLMQETLVRTNLGRLHEGDAVNLERPLTAGERLDGHFVLGHVDGVCDVIEVTPAGGDKVFRLSLPDTLRQYVIPKGSVALDGVSLTVVEAAPESFTVSIMPYTLEHTTFGTRNTGDAINFEADVLGKYVERLLAPLVRSEVSAHAPTSEAAWLPGTIVKGAGRGRALGFPTANVRLDAAQPLPGAGVYAGLVKLPGETGTRQAAVHVGPRPTYEEKPWTFEAHILNYSDGDLYGKPIEVRLVQKLRDVKRFASEAELIEAIRNDCLQVPQVLTE